MLTTLYPLHGLLPLDKNQLHSFCTNAKESLICINFMITRRASFLWKCPWFSHRKLICKLDIHG